MTNIVQGIPPETWEALRERLADHSGLDFTDNYLRGLLSPYPSVAGDLAEFGADTETGGRVLNLVAEDLLGRGWPDNGDGEGEEFFEALRARAAARGALRTAPPEELCFLWGISKATADCIQIEGVEIDHTKLDIQHFVRTTWLKIAASGWHGYLAEGRGALVVELPCALDHFRRGTPTECCSMPVSYAGVRGVYFAARPRLLESVRTILDAYDPLHAVLIAFVDPEQKSMLQLFSAFPAPKDIDAYVEAEEKLDEAVSQLLGRA